MNIGAENYAAIPRLWIMKRILLMAVAAVMLAAPFTVAQAAPFEGFPKEKPADKNVVEVVFATNMHCENCVKKINENIAFLKGVKDLKVSLKDQTIKIKYDRRKTDEKTLAAAIKNLATRPIKCGKITIMSQKPSIPKGTRDFGQQSMAERNYIFETIKKVFRTFGYAQIETPAMENLSTLLGKYGEEGDKLLFRVLNSGDCFSKVNLEDYCKDGCVNSVALSKEVCEKGLRYDLTVPFARFVVQHQSEISFPYKRFQIQPVWRADRPQKGRYREFYQCDVDVIGSKSQVNELELVQIVDKVFSLLDVNVLVKINNRKVLTGFAEICGFPDKVVDITVAIDKLDKIGLESVEEEMREKGLTDSAVAVIEQILRLSGSTSGKLASMRSLMNGGSASGIVSETGLKGLDELEELFGLIDAAGVKCPVEDRSFPCPWPELLHRCHL